VNAVAYPVNNGIVTYPGSASFFPTPWLVNTIMSSGRSDHTKLIPTGVNAAANTFNIEHKNDPSYLTTATKHADNFLLWCWGTGAGCATAARMILDPNNADLKQLKKDSSNAFPNLG
jgi:hypothetical protein